MKIFLFIFLSLFSSCTRSGNDKILSGHWEGKINSGGRALSIIFDISSEKFYYSIPEMLLFSQPVSKWEVNGDEFTMEIEGKEPIIVEGAIKESTINASIDIEDITLSLNRTSREPVFYEEEEVSYKSDGVLISGTLIKPKTAQPYPVIVFVHGSGKMTRETMRSRAYMLVESGAGALIFDRRGKGSSEGDTSRILPISVMTNDVIAAVKFLKSRGDIDSSKIGLYGLSQGAWVAPNAAYLCRDVSFLITISAPGITPDAQNEYVVNNVVQKELNKIFEKNPWHNYSGRREDSLLNYSNRNNMEESGTEIVPGFSRFDPLEAWSNITIPVLCVWGEKDDIVPPELSRTNIENALSKAGNTKYTLKTFEGANHTIKLVNEETKFAGKWEICARGSNEFIAGWLKNTVLKK